jgi:hypothetical protein
MDFMQGYARINAMLTFEPAEEGQIDEVAAFLRQRFGVSPEHRPFRPDVLRWKCFAPHPFWKGSRSYVYRRDGRIVAHGCVVPVHWLMEEGLVSTACVIDWAADPSIPGIGLLLYRGIAELLDGLMGIGGSDDARRTLPHAGFRVIGTIAVLGRVTSPAEHHLQSDRPKDWKTPIRLARDVMRMAQPWPEVPAGWSAEQVSQFDLSIQPAFPAPGRPSPAVAERSVDLLNYCLACPAAQMEAYRVRGPNSATGYFLLSKIAHESRICDLGLSTRAPEDWSALASLAIAEARKDASTTEIRVAASSTLVRELFEGMSFQQESSQPVFYWDRAKKGIEAREISMTFIENDFFYL